MGLFIAFDAAVLLGIGVGVMIGILPRLHVLLPRIQQKFVARCFKMSGAKTLTKMMSIGTHSGKFHCDEVFACHMLRLLPEYKEANIVRTRDAGKLAKCDVVVDVGGVYDPSTHRYDHHQQEFNGTMKSLGAGKWTTRLSSAGLVYLHFGRRVIAQLTGLDAGGHVTGVIFDKVYENFVEEVDAIDNGIDVCDAPRYALTTHLSARVNRLMPPWNELDKHTDENLDKLFAVAMEKVGEEFADRVTLYAKVWWPARKLVEQAHDKRFEVDASGKVLSFDAVMCPWKDHLFDIEEEKHSEPLIKYILFKDAVNDTWRIQCVPINKTSFGNRLSLPKQWCGLRDDKLSGVAGIRGCIFVHATGFIGGNDTYDGVLQMAREALRSDTDAAT